MKLFFATFLLVVFLVVNLTIALVLSRDRLEKASIQTVPTNEDFPLEAVRDDDPYLTATTFPLVRCIEADSSSEWCVLLVLSRGLSWTPPSGSREMAVLEGDPDKIWYESAAGAAARELREEAKTLRIDPAVWHYGSLGEKKPFYTEFKRPTLKPHLQEKDGSNGWKGQASFVGRVETPFDAKQFQQMAEVAVKGWKGTKDEETDKSREVLGLALVKVRDLLDKVREANAGNGWVVDEKDNEKRTFMVPAHIGYSYEADVQKLASRLSGQPKQYITRLKSPQDQPNLIGAGTPLQLRSSIAIGMVDNLDKYETILNRAEKGEVGEVPAINVELKHREIQRGYGAVYPRI